MPNLYDIDWSSSMKQTYEFYRVDPISWSNAERITSIESCIIDWDSSKDTLGSASFSCTEPLDECYIRTYLVVTQNKITKRFCLGTHLVQAPSFSFDGKVRSMSLEGYTPLIELKSDSPPIGYILKKPVSNERTIMDEVYDICRIHMRAPVVKAGHERTLTENYISNADDTWFSLASDLLANIDYMFDMDDVGRIIFSPKPQFTDLNPKWVFTDDNSSVLLPDISDSGDLFEVPNVVEVLYSDSDHYFYSKVVNDDPTSPVSIISRGRTVLHRETSPSISGDPTQEYIDIYAKNLLTSLSSLQHEVSFKHAYCPLKIGDCILLNYKSAGLENVKAVITNQSIDCSTGCIVDTTAVYTTKLWRK